MTKYSAETSADIALNAYPRRTQRRQETRARIVAAASSLFRQVGYADTTMAAIADAADVHVTTLFTHFKAKRDLAATLGDEAIEQLSALIGQSRGITPFFQFFRSVIEGAAKDYQDNTGPNIAFGHDLRLDPELAYGWLHYEGRQIDLMADYLAADFEIDKFSDIRPTLIASLLVAGVTLAHDRWLASSQTLSLAEESLRAFDLAERMALQILPSKELG